MSLNKIEFAFEGNAVVIEADKYFIIEEDLNKAIQSISGRQYEIASYIAHFKHAKEEEDITYNAYWSRRYHELKATAYEQLYQKKPTEQSLEYALNEDRTVLAHKRNIAKFQLVIDQLYSLLNSLETKIEMIKEIGSHTRSQLRLRENQ